MVVQLTYKEISAVDINSKSRLVVRVVHGKSASDTESWHFDSEIDEQAEKQKNLIENTLNEQTKDRLETLDDLSKGKQVNKKRVKQVPVKRIEDRLDQHKLKDSSEISGKISNKQSREQLKNPSSEYLKIPSNEQLQNPSRELIKNLSKEELKKPSKEQIKIASREQLKRLSKEQLKIPSRDQLNESSRENLQTPSRDQLKGSSNELQKHPSREESKDWTKTLSKDKLESTSKEQMKKQSNDQIKQSPREQLKSPSKEQLIWVEPISKQEKTNKLNKTLEQEQLDEQDESPKKKIGCFGWVGKLFKKKKKSNQ